MSVRSTTIRIADRKPSFRRRARPVPRRDAGARAFACALAAALPLLVAGCAGNPRTQAPFDELAEPGPTVRAQPPGGPGEQGFLGLMRQQCGDFSVGESTVAALLESDPRFLSLTTGLYHGELSNDGYTRRVLDAHPAADGNIEATGCVVNQLQACFGGRCEPPGGTRPLPARDNDAAIEAFGDEAP